MSLFRATSVTDKTRVNFYEEFKKFLQAKAKMDEIWRFWIQFVFTDALAYIGLYLAIRSGDWSLREACIKEMAALFTAFDHQTYQKLITQHLCDIHNMNPSYSLFSNKGHLL